MAFTPKITKARFVFSPFSSEEMLSLGDTVSKSIIDRIKSGTNCNDQPAKPLKPGRAGKRGYPDRKATAGIAPIRNWISPIRWPKDRIKTLRALKTKSANENRVTIGFIDPKADQIAHINNGQERMFGLSPKDTKVLVDTVTAMKRKLVSVKKIA